MEKKEEEMDRLHENSKFLYSKGHYQGEKTTDNMGENTCKLYIRV